MHLAEHSARSWKTPSAGHGRYDVTTKLGVGVAFRRRVGWQQLADGLPVGFPPTVEMRHVVDGGDMALELFQPLPALLGDIHVAVQPVAQMLAGATVRDLVGQGCPNFCVNGDSVYASP